ncbi:chemotaxis protein CheB (plasmid) [Paracoccus liaowanqingii]|uniref:protein-glutamate methylesterase n=1 Tax=Paracoccus liaowanqingii TaxID=2560053 RepID=A0A4Y5SS60_9RHOB|nr:chemotaxis protein CheB [Paracoccus liaowanqingii]QDA35773.1 chemotaxis protein CheB [Paracoccus liaowanqingii]
MTGREIIVIGGSAGSVEVIRQICRALPADLRAPVLIAVHVGAGHQNLLASILDSGGPHPASTAVDGEPLQPGRIYVAPSDHHLVIDGRILRLGRGPRENMARPAIDPLFRSAGISFGPRAIGVLLSGMLNDGASGLADLKRCGGVTVVQSPLDAVESEMPRTALLASDIDYRASAAELADVLSRLVNEEPGPAPVPPPSVALEVAIAMGRPSDSSTMAKIADPVPLNCPGCGGTLSQIRRSPLRFRCQVGHGYTAEALAHEQEGSVDEAIRIALRVIGERADLMEKMAIDALQAGRTAAAATFEERADEYRRSAGVLTDAALRG